MSLILQTKHHMIKKKGRCFPITLHFDQNIRMLLHFRLHLHGLEYADFIHNRGTTRLFSRLRNTHDKHPGLGLLHFTCAGACDVYCVRHNSRSFIAGLALNPPHVQQ